MKLIKSALLGLVVLVALLLGIGAFLPREWNVRVEVALSASPEAIYPFVADFKKWDRWAVFDVGDRSEVRTYSEETMKAGSWQRWDGKKVGRGQIWLLTADPKTGITYESAIQSPEKNSGGSIQWSVVPPTVQNGRPTTSVTWEDRGTLPPLIGGYFKSAVERALTDHFRKSLQRLNQHLAEHSPEKAPPQKGSRR